VEYRDRKSRDMSWSRDDLEVHFSVLVLVLNPDVLVLRSDVLVLRPGVLVLNPDVLILRSDVLVLNPDVLVLRSDVVVLVLVLRKMSRVVTTKSLI